RPLGVVPNGTSLPELERPARAAGPVRLGIIGRLSEQKRHGLLLEALARLPADAFRLSIVGGDDKSLEERAAALGLADRIGWTGFVGDRSAIYRDLDVVVAPAGEEGFGLPGVE